MLSRTLKPFQNMPLRNLPKRGCRELLIFIVAANKKFLPVTEESVKSKVREMLSCCVVTWTSNSASGISADHTGWHFSNHNTVTIF